MVFAERFTDSDPQASRTALRERADNLLARVKSISPDEMVPAEWEDEELAAEQGIQLEPKWKQVEVHLGGEVKSLEIAPVISPQLNTGTGKETNRRLTIIGKINSGKDGEYSTIGAMYPGPSVEDDPYVVLNNSPDTILQNFVPLDSADAALFMELADQVLPRIN